MSEETLKQLAGHVSKKMPCRAEGIQLTYLQNKRSGQIYDFEAAQASRLVVEACPSP